MIIQAPCIWPDDCHFKCSGECFACVQYQECKIKPNYPMPAIPLKVKFEWLTSWSKFPQHTTHHANDTLVLRIYKHGMKSRIGNRWQSWFGPHVRFTNNYDGQFN